MTAARHARDGQRRDWLTAIARDTWTLIRLSWLILATQISRRVPRAAGGAPGRPPRAGAPEVPAPATSPPGGAGTSLKLRNADPEAAAAPATPGAARPPWVITQPPPGTPMGYMPVGRGAAGRRETIAMPALDTPLRPYYLAHLARQDAMAATL
jgi:hypothetical protein